MRETGKNRLTIKFECMLREPIEKNMFFFGFQYCIRNRAAGKHNCLIHNMLFDHEVCNVTKEHNVSHTQFLDISKTFHTQHINCSVSTVNVLHASNREKKTNKMLTFSNLFNYFLFVKQIFFYQTAKNVGIFFYC